MRLVSVRKTDAGEILEVSRHLGMTCMRILCVRIRCFRSAGPESPGRDAAEYELCILSIITVLIIIMFAHSNNPRMQVPC